MPKNRREIHFASATARLHDAPALTLMESPEFRVRMGTHRSAAAEA